MKRVVKKILSFLMALATELVAVTVGKSLLPQDSPAAQAAYWVCIAVLVVLFLLNLRHFLKGKQRITSEEFLQQRDTVFAAHDQAKSDPDVLISRMEHSLLQVRLYYVLVLLLAFFMIFFSSTIHAGSFTSISHLLALYILWGLYQMLFQVEDPMLPEYPLSRDDYPELYRMADEVREIAGVNMPIRLFLGGENFSVAVINQEIIILLSAQETSLLTRDELKQVLLHELGHVVNQDSIRLARYQKLLQRWDASNFDYLTWYGTITMTIPTEKLAEQCALYLIATSSRYEENADALVLRLGDSQDLINALAKISMLDFFRAEPCPELDFEYLDRDAPLEQYNDLFLSCFSTYLQEKEPQWRRVLALQLPARVDSHPIFRQRMEALNVTNYSVHSVETNAAYQENVARLRALDNSLYYQFASENWSETTEEHKLRKSRMRQYKEANAPFEDFSTQELYDMAYAFMGVEDDTGITILDYILSQEPNNAYALSLKGAALLRQSNIEGAELLFQAAQKSVNFIDEYLEPVGEYARNTGNQELLERYRDALVQFSTEKIDRDNSLGDSNKQSQLQYSDLSPVIFDAVLCHIKASDQGALSEVLTIKKVVGQDYVYMYFLIFKDGISDELKHEVYYAIFRYLDMADEHFSLETTDTKQKTYKQLKQWLPDCSIYPES